NIRRGMSTEAPGLYLHLPFCSAICPYCDFSVLTGDREKRRSFVEDLLAELDLVEETWPAFETIYLGGGTPSLMEVEDLARVLDGVKNRFAVQEGAGLFFEANPEDVTTETLSGWRDLGAATLSLGVQSFDEGQLRFLGRRHDPQTARSAVSMALAAGLDTVSLDLIFGLPGQSRSRWQADLEAAVELQPHHVSCYQLTVHERTVFGARSRQGGLEEMGNERQAELFYLTHELLRAAGYEAYEVSNFASAPVHRSRHNLKHWRHAPYLGLGPSAHSYDGDGRRWWNERSLAGWQQKTRAGKRPIAAEENLSPTELLLETLMLGLRMREGVDLEEIRLRFGVDLEKTNRELLETLEADGLVLREGARLLPTLGGLAVADGLAADFDLSESASRAVTIPIHE
ncbi:MAG: radical SAM family heme chaperone HemW, partial [Acidobacteriota bacterium]|nr:radical SAM family heme chaperone HemW [Acidobacteriota bacterium]